MEDYIKLEGLPEWFEWNVQTQEGRTLDREETYIRCGKECTRIRKGVDPKTWSTSKTDQRPYLQLSINGKHIKLHKYELIWMAHHHQPIPDGSVIHHVDFNKDNNDISNLQLLTEEEHWKIHTEAAINNPKRSTAIIAEDNEGNVVFEFPSLMEAERQGFKHNAISDCLNGIRNRHRGLRWRRKNG